LSGTSAIPKPASISRFCAVRLSIRSIRSAVMPASSSTRRPYAADTSGRPGGSGKAIQRWSASSCRPARRVPAKACSGAAATTSRSADVQLGLRYTRTRAPKLHSRDPVRRAAGGRRRARARLRGHRRRAGLHELADQRWIAFPEPPGRPEVFRRVRAPGAGGRRITADRMLRIDSLTAQKRLIEAGFGIALVPDSSIRRSSPPVRWLVLDVAGLDLSLQVAVLTRRDGYLGAATRTLLAELRAQTP